MDAQDGDYLKEVLREDVTVAHCQGGCAGEVQGVDVPGKPADSEIFNALCPVDVRVGQGDKVEEHSLDKMKCTKVWTRRMQPPKSCMIMLSLRYFEARILIFTAE